MTPDQVTENGNAACAPRDDVTAPPPAKRDRDIPDWIAEVGQAPLVRKVLETVRAISAFTRHPRRFSAEWGNEQGSPANPLLLMITALSAITPALEVSDRYVGYPPSTLFVSFMGNLAPFAYYAALGLIAHIILFAFGARTPLRGSLGVSLFTGAGPGMLVTLGMRAIGVALYARYGTPEFTVLGRFVGLLILTALIASVLASLALALAGVNDVSIGKAIAAVLVATVVCGWILQPFGDYCSFAHVDGRLHHGAHGWSFEGGFRS